MNDLSVKLWLEPKKGLVAVDETTYYPSNTIISGLYSSVEFLTEHDNTNPIHLNIKNYQVDDNTTIFNLSYDGWYDYYKYVIPKLEYFIKADADKYTASIKGQYFEYNGDIYFGSENITTEADNIDEFIAENKSIITADDVKVSLNQYSLLYGDIQSGISNVSLAQKETFVSVEALREC